jgi:hypothetical protein
MEVVCCVYSVWCTQGSPDCTVHNNRPQTVRSDAARKSYTRYGLQLTISYCIILNHPELSSSPRNTGGI